MAYQIIPVEEGQKILDSKIDVESLVTYWLENDKQTMYLVKYNGKNNLLVATNHYTNCDWFSGGETIDLNNLWNELHYLGFGVFKTKQGTHRIYFDLLEK